MMSKEENEASRPKKMEILPCVIHFEASRLFFYVIAQVKIG